MSFHIPAAENELLVYLFEHAPVTTKAELFAYRSPEDDQIQYVVALPLKEESSLYLVSTLASRSNHVFLTITESEPSNVAAILTDIESYDAFASHLPIGSTVPLEQEEEQKGVHAAALFLQPNVSGALEDFPEIVSIGSREIHFLFTLFLDENEYDLKQKKGLDALLDHFESTHRGL